MKNMAVSGLQTGGAMCGWITVGYSSISCGKD